MNWQNKLNQAGYRLTRPRRVVMDILEKASTPLSPQNIYQRSTQTREAVGLVSVYRTLDLMTELALVRKVHSGDGCHGYVLASPGHHHHLVCRSCDKAVEFTGADDLSHLIQQIQNKTGFQVNGHLLQLYGLCPECQQEEKASKS